MRRIWLALGAALGRLVFALGIRRKIALANLARAFPDRADLRDLARRSYALLGTNLAEIAATRGLSAEALEKLVHFDGWERYETARAKGKGVVFAIAHFGNWELLARASARRGISLSFIGRALRGRANRLLLEARVEGGARQLADKGSSKEALALLRRGETLAIMIDQNMLRRRGIFVDFFGVPACTTPAAAVFALRSGAPLLAAFPIRQPDGTHRVVMQGPFEPPAGLHGHAAVVALTQAVTRAVEDAVREHPEHWFWLHRRWKTRPLQGTG